MADVRRRDLCRMLGHRAVKPVEQRWRAVLNVVDRLEVRLLRVAKVRGRVDDVHAAAAFLDGADRVRDEFGGAAGTLNLQFFAQQGGDVARVYYGMIEIWRVK